jgi:hypothetical protein
MGLLYLYLLAFLCYSLALYTLLLTLILLLLFMLLPLLILLILLVLLCLTSRRIRPNHFALSVQFKLRHSVFSMCVFRLFVFGQWNFHAEGWERVSGTAIPTADWRTQQDKYPLLAT